MFLWFTLIFRSVYWNYLRNYVLSCQTAPLSVEVRHVLPPLLLYRTSVCLCIRGGPLHVPLSERERSRTGLWEDGLLSCGAHVSEWHWWSFPAGRHMDHLHEGSTQLFPLWRCSLLLPRAAEHLLPSWARSHLWSLHHQRVSGCFINYLII